MKSERILLLAMAVALGIGCFLVLLPFLPAMLWAGILVYCAWPLYERFTRLIPAPVASFVITIVIAGIVLVPLIHLGLVVAKEAKQSQGWVHDAIMNGLPPAPSFLGKIPVIGTLLMDFWNDSSSDIGGASSELQPIVGTVAHSGIHLIFAITHGLIGAVIALFITYFFFLSGQAIVARIRMLLIRITNENRVDHMLGLMALTVRSVVLGILGTSAMQGVLYVIGFEIAGAPQALLLASFAGLFSIIPAGAVVIYVPLCLYMMAKGHAISGIFLAIYCFVVVGGADSIVRPWLIARGASLPYVLTLIGVLGGAIAFGALGIFLGPVLLVLGMAVAEEFAGAPRGAWREPAD